MKQWCPLYVFLYSYESDTVISTLKLYKMSDAQKLQKYIIADKHKVLFGYRWYLS